MFQSFFGKTKGKISSFDFSLGVLAAVFSGAFFSLDLLLPLGVAAGIPYVAVVLLGWRFPARRSVLFLASLSTFLILLGYWLSPEGGIPWVVAANRVLAILAVWVVAILLFRTKAKDDVLKESYEALAAATRGLAEGETRLRLLTDAVPVVIAYVDSEQRYRFNNRAHTEWIGRSADELFGKKLSEILPPETYASVRPHVERGLAGEKVDFEPTFPR